MRSSWRVRLVAALGLLAVGLLFSPAAARGQGAKGKPNTKSVTFTSADGVKLSGTLYPNPGKDAVVLLLHDFDLKKGGSSQQEGWTKLAANLQKSGYVVFMFDFRGFGESKTLENKNDFWKQPYNGIGSFKKGAMRKDSIEHKDFTAAYLKYLVNDVAAAKAYLDRRNDDKDMNTSNLIVIGAGEGATVGAMWLVHECRRRKDKSKLNFGLPQMGDPEAKDVAAAIWLTIGPKVGSTTVNLSRLVAEAGGKEHKVPTLFVFGKNDVKGDNLALKLYQSINPQGTKSKDFKHTGRKSIPDTRLVGQALLSESETIPAIKDYIKDVMETRNVREHFKREAKDYRYVYTIKGKYFKDNKPLGDLVPKVDVTFILGR